MSCCSFTRSRRPAQRQGTLPNNALPPTTTAHTCRNSSRFCVGTWKFPVKSTPRFLSVATESKVFLLDLGFFSFSRRRFGHVTNRLDAAASNKGARPRTAWEALREALKILDEGKSKKTDPAAADGFFGRTVSLVRTIRVEDNAFHLKNNYCVAHAHQVFHPRGIPVCKTNATVTCGAANCLRIVRAVNANARFV